MCETIAGISGDPNIFLESQKNNPGIREFTNTLGGIVAGGVVGNDDFYVPIGLR